MTLLKHIKTQSPNGWISMGGASIGNLYREISDADAQTVLQTAWDMGLRYFDTAPFYGKGLSEQRMGQFLKNKHRSAFAISTKVGRLLKPLADGQAPDQDMFVNALPNTVVYDYSYDGILQSVEDSLNRLNLDKIDIAYVHDIGTYTHGDTHHTHMKDLTNGGGFKALQSLKNNGTIGGFGLGVNEKQVCLQALEYTDLDTILLAGRYSLLEQDSLDDLLVTCEKRHTEIVIGGVFNSGMLANPNRTENLMYDYAPAPDYMVQHMHKLYEICDAHNTPLPAVAIQFCNAHPVVQSVLIGTASVDKLTTSIQWATHNIPNDLWHDLRNSGLIHKNAPLPIDKDTP